MDNRLPNPGHMANLHIEYLAVGRTPSEDELAKICSVDTFSYWTYSENNNYSKLQRVFNSMGWNVLIREFVLSCTTQELYCHLFLTVSLPRRVSSVVCGSL